MLVVVQPDQSVGERQQVQLSKQGRRLYICMYPAWALRSLGMKRVAETRHVKSKNVVNCACLMLLQKRYNRRYKKDVQAEV